MDSTTESPFRRTAGELGMPPKLMYSVKEVARVTGVPYSTLLAECRAGRLRSYLPKGRKQGWKVRPEWVDEWIETGGQNA